jgi:hypothetical protein
LKLLGGKSIGDFSMWRFAMIGAYEDRTIIVTGERWELVVLAASMEQGLS